MQILPSCLLITAALVAAMAIDLTSDPPNYGVDCSSPIHWGVSDERCKFWGDKYAQLLTGCNGLYSKEECEQNERDRLDHNRRQPPLQHNYTEIGFKKIRAPKEIMEPLMEFYNKYKDRKVLEKWYRGATIVNSWDSPTYMVSFENPEFPEGMKLKNMIWEGVRKIVQEWVGGHTLEPTSLYGVRIYTNGAILAEHVDRLPLVSSCIINLDQDLDEPWPLEVYDHQGRAYNVSMEPGDLVLYESATILHGRPFPMKGRHYSNVFVHFQPVAHDELNDEDEEQRALNGEAVSIARHHARMRTNKLRRRMTDEDTIRIAAANGNLAEVKRLLSSKPALLHAQDENGWQAIHEAARSGDLDLIKFLIAKGANLSHKVQAGDTVLGVAKSHFPEDHEVVKYLVKLGAPGN